MADCQLTNKLADGELLVRRLIGWRENKVEDRWAFLACSFLIQEMKKFGDWREYVSALEFAIRNPDSYTRCILVPQNSHYGLISFQKVYFHSITCKIWRWSDLESHSELNPKDHCPFTFTNQMPHVCINPYHYERNRLPPSYKDSVMQDHQQSSFLPDSPDSLGAVQSPNNLLNASATSDDGNSFGTFESFGQSSACSSHLSPQCVSQSPPPYEVMKDNAQASFGVSSQFPNYGNQLNSIKQMPVHSEEPMSWASVSYYEMNIRVGNTFNALVTPIQIDGFSDPPSNSSKRMSLGSLSNPNRTPCIEAARKHIGEGVILWCENGEIFLKCASKHAIFIHSVSCNILSNLPIDEIIKIHSGSIVRLFNEVNFANLIRQKVYENFEAVFALTKLCVVRISFVKGFGSTYTRRDITNTPCWVEIKFHRPLTWVDKVLTQMGTPNTNISSVS